ncbi:hypothetical protein [Kitasatospora sp. NPDC094011]|uniref:hypothetical protein n=1 Tax=Kitasatospora sp. NPDC094011 TaxID=3364090 RepID=UPI003802FE5E
MRVADADGAREFDEVRRGYNRAEVDAYFNLPAGLRPDGPGFAVARRGYDRDQVDRAVAAARQPAPAPADAPVSDAPVSAPVSDAPVSAGAGAGGYPGRGFDLVRHGYERAQVDAHLALPAGGRPVCPRFRIAGRGYDPGQVEEALAAAHPSRTGAPAVPVFATAWRGYDPVLVDAHLASAPHHRPAPGALPLVRGGYRRAQVDAYLTATGPHAPAGGGR